jgi:dTDP-4-dehydrorhamnose 3,5-epimerase
MIITPTSLDDVFLIELKLIKDERGWFARTFCGQTFARHGLVSHVSQTNHSYCRQKGILRGLHYQRPPGAEAKIIRCVQGKVFDVAVDVRKGSPTFRKWFGVHLSANEPRAVYVGQGFAHGYLSLVDHSAVVYHTSAPYAPELEGCIRFDDPSICIRWPIRDPKLSLKDSGTVWLDESFEGITLVS